MAPGSVTLRLRVLDQPVDGRLGPQPVVLDHTSGFEGLLFVDDDLLGVRRGHGPDSLSTVILTSRLSGHWTQQLQLHQSHHVCVQR